MLKNNNMKRTHQNIPYHNLPSPTSHANIVHLQADLEAQYPENRKTEISIRKCIFNYAKEAENERAKIHPRRYGGNTGENQDSRDHVKSKVPVLGSEERFVGTNGNYGFFSTIFEAYNNHWSIRTCVEDWWYTLIHKIGLAIDDNAESDEVRKFFVSHEGKKTLTVEVGPSIYGVDYSWFLDQMTNQISENIKVPSYVDTLKADYSTSTKTHIIVSEITVMASVQKYFEYAMMCGCGIPSLEMEGDEEDWKRMKNKFVQLKELLKPIHKAIRLDEKWWNGVERICDRLISTFNGKPDVEWWSNIFQYGPGWGPSGMRIENGAYDGWFISEFLGLGVGSITDLSKLQSSIVTVPMKITDAVTGVSEDSAFAAGIAGFEMFKEEASPWPSVKAAHGWTLMLQHNSAFKEDLTTWENQLSQGA